MVTGFYQWVPALYRNNPVLWRMYFCHDFPNIVAVINRCQMVASFDCLAKRNIPASQSIMR
jgi:hypothetical protein